MGLKIPMLLTSTSTSGTASASIWQPAAVETSVATPEIFAPGCDFRISAIAAFTRSCVRPFTITDAPSAASPRAVANPIPAVDPVTNAALPFSWRSILPFVNREDVLRGFRCNESPQIFNRSRTETNTQSQTGREVNPRPYKEETGPLARLPLRL